MSDRDDAAAAQNGDSEVREPSERDPPLEELTERITDDRRSGSGEGDDGISDIVDDVASDTDSTGERSPTESTASTESSVDGEEIPLERIAGNVRERRHRRERDESGLFEEIDVGAVGSEDVWADLLSEEDGRESERAVGAGASAVEAGTAGMGDRTEHIVPKAEFCGRCPHLSQPPELACEHDGTEIVEVTDSEHFRVRGCPFTDRDESDLADLD